MRIEMGWLCSDENPWENKMENSFEALHWLRNALEEPETNPDQYRIAVEGLKWIKLILDKNKDYGGSVWKSPILNPSLSVSETILVRMSDKITRLSNLTQNGTPEVNESFEDTINDLGAYCLLYLARPKNQIKGQ